jgi:hypothetical protein
MRRAPSESAAQQDLEKVWMWLTNAIWNDITADLIKSSSNLLILQTIEKGKCILDNAKSDDFVIDLSDEKVLYFLGHVKPCLRTIIDTD